PLTMLVGSPFIQATRGYAPQDSVRVTSDHPAPAWPQLRLNRHLYGDKKPSLQSPMTFVGDVPAQTTVKIMVGQVSNTADLQVLADGRIVAEKAFRPGPGEGEWKQVIYSDEWHIYQNRYDRVYEFTIPQPAKEIAFYLGKGDWLTFGYVEIGARRFEATDFR